MAIENLSSYNIETILAEIGTIGKWAEAIGLAVVIWLVIQIVNFVLNRKKLENLKQIKEDLRRIEKKVDKLSSKRR